MARMLMSMRRRGRGGREEGLEGGLGGGFDGIGTFPGGGGGTGLGGEGFGGEGFGEERGMMGWVGNRELTTL